MNQRLKQSLLFSLIASIIAHYIFFTFGYFFLPSLFPVNQEDLKKNHQIRDNLIYFKNLGSKNGKNRHFTLKNHGPKLKQGPHLSTKKSSQSESSDLKDLKDLKLKKSQSTFSGQGPQAKNHKEPPLTQKDVRFQQKLSNQIFPNLSAIDQHFLSHTGPFMNLETPRGVPYDELNSSEKKFFSFQKRTYENYVNALLSSYHNIIKGRPRLVHELFSSDQHLSAQMTIDPQGNVQSLKFIRWSDNEDLQKLFEDALKGIHLLPNPPKELFDNQTNDQNLMNIYFQLIIKN